MAETVASMVRGTREHSIGDLLRRSARRDPVICGEVSWTFADMGAIRNRLGRGPQRSVGGETLDKAIQRNNFPA